MRERIGGEIQPKKGRNKERRKVRKRGKKEKEREKERKKRKEGWRASSSDLPMFRKSEFVGSRVKVCLRSEGYTPRGRDFSSFGLFSP